LKKSKPRRKTGICGSTKLKSIKVKKFKNIKKNREALLVRPLFNGLLLRIAVRP